MESAHHFSFQLRSLIKDWVVCLPKGLLHLIFFNYLWCLSVLNQFMTCQNQKGTDLWYHLLDYNENQGRDLIFYLTIKIIWCLPCDLRNHLLWLSEPLNENLHQLCDEKDPNHLLLLQCWTSNARMGAIPFSDVLQLLLRLTTL